MRVSLEAEEEWGRRGEVGEESVMRMSAAALVLGAILGVLVLATAKESKAVLPAPGGNLTKAGPRWSNKPIVLRHQGDRDDEEEYDNEDEEHEDDEEEEEEEEGNRLPNYIFYLFAINKLKKHNNKST